MALLYQPNRKIDLDKKATNVYFVSKGAFVIVTKAVLRGMKLPKRTKLRTDIVLKPRRKFRAKPIK
jgi:hypothetical protein